MKLFSCHLRTALFFGVIALASIALWSGMPAKETTIEIRVARQGNSLPDGFYVWHHLDANGIRFKSITPQNNNLLITFASSAQSEAAKEVLNRALPGGYVIDQRDSNNQDALTWLSILRVSKHV
ncbi:EnvZ/OmpR regulon moderator MzrA [Citrobacter sp. JGM124]|uniref:EnvZ/OmpR regulon moderator MzrA n=1 Tax=Citrobacter sp. JGM124 TaxID=2799789 RepID=UPI001BA585CF|nr:EnvZ/OmpR regulon moderator MzrA [Citrobacter sp. JGM124]MBS0849201.1 EnvZ/OmpR regulon moderator MzrA [Citrobacter sp. JGM124]